MDFDTGRRIDRRAIPADAVEGTWTASDGHPIRRIDWPGHSEPDAPTAPRGSLLFLPGRGDFYEKYLESLDYWHCEGWRVTALDWRGQAGSGRLSSDPMTGHVPDFGLWLDDLGAFWTDWVRDTPGPHVVVGHSMGGHLVLRALAERRIDPAAVVLSAPMLGFLTPGPNRVLHRVAEFMCRIGDPERSAWKSSEKPGATTAARNTLLTHDEARYGDETHWKTVRPELAMGPGSWRWVERAYASMLVLDRPGLLEAVDVPVLLLAARHDGLVSWRAIERAARRLPRAQLMTWGREARHELLREADPVRDKVMHAIDDFLDRLAPPTGEDAPA
ncbi:lysophospholipase L2 [Novosphingobium aromaticivorans DSM 12444]|uniref:Lysophospholipase L2 n=1 Tax=Novosphingobium aromaticivorans (strain ATCC 700278 / DSM 12444 / CCUG 56034 / CIP 105152 / NBRC 16084 / F199) TaxID=279238 RepID=Q2G9E6_NOVAD|nr:alpha/beta hydrolase [Novosphingobium aromaticivorans]ABD25527.1 lysophospholipase L2 [Novosphingobium aromaticivorans DSM 12444]SCX96397.1 lysophospholipase [Novosphingobium aromaticivorans]